MNTVFHYQVGGPESAVLDWILSGSKLKNKCLVVSQRLWHWTSDRVFVNLWGPLSKAFISQLHNCINEIKVSHSGCQITVVPQGRYGLHNILAIIFGLALGSLWKPILTWREHSKHQFQDLLLTSTINGAQDLTFLLQKQKKDHPELMIIWSFFYIHPILFGRIFW